MYAQSDLGHPSQHRRLVCPRACPRCLVLLLEATVLQPVVATAVEKLRGWYPAARQALCSMLPTGSAQTSSSSVKLTPSATLLHGSTPLSPQTLHRPTSPGQLRKFFFNTPGRLRDKLRIHTRHTQACKIDIARSLQEAALTPLGGWRGAALSSQTSMETAGGGGRTWRWSRQATRGRRIGAVEHSGTR